eukprot:CAMPEP_0182432712 /NCGR_PEP_ID=MMETSP1167-20130531/58398_1 /TAXON_ID=2988 /ORGANISM="Mallomonas Sp, Strain CCMP3275" /LENGTH=71 /DNA_ID=CAMNT_0024620547 /DNA_START=18 /DNA_END=229 /DNA_ORIENTATION=-
MTGSEELIRAGHLENTPTEKEKDRGSEEVVACRRSSVDDGNEIGGLDELDTAAELHDTRLDTSTVVANTMP